MVGIFVGLLVLHIHWTFPTCAGGVGPRLGGGEEEVGGGLAEGSGENKTRSGGQDDRDAEGVVGVVMSPGGNAHV